MLLTLLLDLTAQAAAGSLADRVEDLRKVVPPPPPHPSHHPIRCPRWRDRLQRAATLSRSFLAELRDCLGRSSGTSRCPELYAKAGVETVLGVFLRSQANHLYWAERCGLEDEQTRILATLLEVLARDGMTGVIGALGNETTRRLFEVALWIVRAVEKGDSVMSREMTGLPFDPSSLVRQGGAEALVTELRRVPASVLNELWQRGAAAVRDQATLTDLMSQRAPGWFSVVALDAEGRPAAEGSCEETAARLVESALAGHFLRSGLIPVRDIGIRAPITRLAQRLVEKGWTGWRENNPAVPDVEEVVAMRISPVIVLAAKTGGTLEPHLAFPGRRYSDFRRLAVTSPLADCADEKTFAAQLEAELLAPMVQLLAVRPEAMERAWDEMHGAQQVGAAPELRPEIRVVAMLARAERWSVEPREICRRICLAPRSRRGQAEGWATRLDLAVWRRAFATHLPDRFDGSCPADQRKSEIGDGVLEWDEWPGEAGRWRYEVSLTCTALRGGEDRVPVKLPLAVMEVRRPAPHDLADATLRATIAAMDWRYESSAPPSPLNPGLPAALRRPWYAVMPAAVVPGLPLAVEPQLGNASWYSYTQAALGAVAVGLAAGLVAADVRRRSLFVEVQNDPGLHGDWRYQRDLTIGLGAALATVPLAGLLSTALAHRFSRRSPALSAAALPGGAGVLLIGEWP